MTEIYNAVVSKGVTPASDSPEDIAAAIRAIVTDVKHSVSVHWQYAGPDPTKYHWSGYVDGRRVAGGNYDPREDWGITV